MAVDSRKNGFPPFSGSPQAGRPHPRKKMLMTPLLVFLGGIFAFAVPTIVAAFFQMMFFTPAPSGQLAPLDGLGVSAGGRSSSPTAASTAIAATRGPQDVREGLYLPVSPRVPAGRLRHQRRQPQPLRHGADRTGPEPGSGLPPGRLGKRPLRRPAVVDPLSIMPSFTFLTNKQVDDLHLPADPVGQGRACCATPASST